MQRDPTAPPYLWGGMCGHIFGWTNGSQESHTGSGPGLALLIIILHDLGEEMPNKISTFADDAKLSWVMERRVICDGSREDLFSGCKVTDGAQRGQSAGQCAQGE